MLEYIILLLLAWPFMAKHGRGRYTLRRVRTTGGITLSTLAANIVITSAVLGAADGQYRIMSAKQTWAMKNLTAGEGPILVGYAHGDYSVTEIKEAIEAGASINRGNMVAREQSDRLVRIVGSFSGAAEEVLNDGRPIHTRLNWAIPIGKTVNIFAYNDSGATLTTGGVVEVTGPVWVKDY